MNSSAISLARAAATFINQNLQGKKRWLSLAAYSLLAISTVAGFQLDALARDVALDPEINKDSTLIAIATAAGITFRFFQNMGRTRDASARVDRVETRLERRGM